MMAKKKARLLYLIIPLFMTGCFLINGTYYEYDRAGNIVYMKQYRCGKKHGTFIEYNSQGDTLSINNYNNGRPEGVSISYYRNGNVKFYTE